MGKDVDTNEKEDNDMAANAMQYRKLDFSKIKDRIVSTISSDEALEDIVPIQWSDEVTSGEKKVVITKKSTE